MAFAFTILSRRPLLPPNKRKPQSGRGELITGTFTNSGGGTGGDIVTESDTVLFASASDKTGAAAIQVEHVATPGTIVITTTADHSGTWMALVQHLSQ